MQDSVNINDYCVTMVYVDSYEDNVLKGRFANPYLEELQNFNSFIDFVIKMECLMDVISLPGVFATNCGVQRNLADGIVSPGKVATFSIAIRFRQNNSWQGTIGWLEPGQKQNFRSVLELITLLDSALSH